MKYFAKKKKKRNLTNFIYFFYFNSNDLITYNTNKLFNSLTDLLSRFYLNIVTPYY